MYCCYKGLDCKDTLCILLLLVFFFRYSLFTHRDPRDTPLPLQDFVYLFFLNINTATYILKQSRPYNTLTLFMCLLLVITTINFVNHTLHNSIYEHLILFKIKSISYYSNNFGHSLHTCDHHI